MATGRHGTNESKLRSPPGTCQAAASDLSTLNKFALHQAVSRPKSLRARSPSSAATAASRRSAHRIAALRSVLLSVQIVHDLGTAARVPLHTQADGKDLERAKAPPSRRRRPVNQPAPAAPGVSDVPAHADSIHGATAKAAAVSNSRRSMLATSLRRHVTLLEWSAVGGMDLLADKESCLPLSTSVPSDMPPTSVSGPEGHCLQLIPAECLWATSTSRVRWNSGLSDPGSRWCLRKLRGHVDEISNRTVTTRSGRPWVRAQPPSGQWTFVNPVDVQPSLREQPRLGGLHKRCRGGGATRPCAARGREPRASDQRAGAGRDQSRSARECPTVPGSVRTSIIVCGLSKSSCRHSASGARTFSRWRASCSRKRPSGWGEGRLPSHPTPRIG